MPKAVYVHIWVVLNSCISPLTNGHLYPNSCSSDKIWGGKEREYGLLEDLEPKMQSSLCLLLLWLYFKGNKIPNGLSL